MSQLVKLDKDYASWIQNLSADLREALSGLRDYLRLVSNMRKDSICFIIKEI